jgi:hypothetical protein
MHKYTVELRIYGKILDPIVVSSDLGLKPSRIVKIGDRRSRNTFWEESMWAYNRSEEDIGIYFDSLEEGLALLIEDLWPVRNKIKNYSSKYEVIWWCGHFQSSFDGGPTLSFKLINLLCKFGAHLFIDNYFSEDLESISTTVLVKKSVRKKQKNNLDTQ